MKKTISICLWIFCCLAICPNSAHATDSLETKAPAYFGGVKYTYSYRTGYYNFSQIKIAQDTTLTPLSLYEVFVGKRYPLLDWLRLTGGISAGFGTADIDTFYSGETFVLQNSFTHGSLDIEAHVLGKQNVLAAKPITPYVRLGTSVDYMHLQQTGYYLSNPAEPFTAFVNSTTWCIGAIGGAGIDIAVSPQLWLGIQYGFKIWEPVQYPFSDDLLLADVTFAELFYSHIFSVQILF